jgi:NADH-quinone oxidoreductase subunit C
MDQNIIASLSEKLKTNFPQDVLSTEMLDQFTITIKKEKILDILQFLYADEELQFQFLTSLCGIHFPDAKEPLGVVYHLHSFKNNLRIRIKLYTVLENPAVTSVTPLFSTANWMERETYDFFGILFKGHPNLKRILNVDEMIMFPMRKEFPLEDQVRVDKDDTMFGR